MLACVLCACGSSDESDDRSEGAGKGVLKWGEVEPLAGIWVNSPVTVMAPQGTATVVWVGEHGAVLREASPGEPWERAEVVPHAGQASHVVAGVDKAGTVTVVWANRADENGDYSMQSAQRPTDGSWSDPVHLGGGPEGDTGWQGWDLAVGPSGAAVFAWGDEDGRMRAVYRPADGAWSAPTSLPEATWPPVPRVTIDPDGLATVAYLRGNRGLLTLVQRSAAGWEEPVKLEMRIGDRPYDIDAAGGGEAVVVWQEGDLRFVTGRLNNGTMTDVRALTETREASVEIQVEAAPDGSARYVWRLADDTPNTDSGNETAKDVYGIHHSSAGTLSEPEVIGPASLCPPAEALPVALDRNDRGDTNLAWSGADPSGLDLAYRSHDAEAWSPQDDAVPDGSGPACFDSPAAALAENGSAVLMWGNFQSNPGHFQATQLMARRATLSK